MLNPNTVQHPQHSRLSMLLHPHSLDVLVTSRVADNSLQWHTLTLDKAAPSVLAAFQNAVYDNPLLLAPFGTVDILVDTPHFIVVPPGTDTETAHGMLAQLYPNEDFVTNLSTAEASGQQSALIATALPTELAKYIGRTFHRPRVAHRLAPMSRFFSVRGRMGNTERIHLHLHAGAIDILAYGRQGLLMANSFVSGSAEDDLYYALAAARSLQFDNSADRMLISGDAARRDALLPLLRRYISYAMPAIFPAAMLRAGSEALNAPFELVSIPLTETNTKISCE